MAKIYWYIRFMIHRLMGWKYFDKIAWMPVKNRKVAFARSRGQTLFYCFGGKREPGESDIETLIREVREEADVFLIPTIRHLKTFYGTASDGRPIRMACFDAEYIGNIAPTNEVDWVEWFTSADKDRTTFMGGLVLQWMKDAGMID